MMERPDIDDAEKLRDRWLMIVRLTSEGITLVYYRKITGIDLVLDVPLKSSTLRVHFDPKIVADKGDLEGTKTLTFIPQITEVGGWVGADGELRCVADLRCWLKP